MWILQNTVNGKQYFLPCNKEVIVGRRDADIVIAGDSSVSRKHGTFNISHPRTNLKNPDAIPIVTYTDSSKFGTFITRGIDEACKVNQTVTINSGNIIQFGAQNSIFKMDYHPIVITTSTGMLENDVKQKVAECIFKCGGHIVTNWHEKVTHLVIEKIKLSVKVTQALASACHIVTPEYIFKLVEMLENVGSLPEPQEYIPQLAEPNLSRELCSFKVDENRKTIFQNKTAVFLNKQQHKRMGLIITAGGGACLLGDDTNINDDLISNQQTFIVNCGIADLKELIISNSSFEHLQEVLVIHGLRLVGEHEIGLAVLYCDASVYCNPAFELNSQNAFTQHPTLETNTQESVEDVEPMPERSDQDRAGTSRDLIKNEPREENVLERPNTSRSSGKRPRSPEMVSSKLKNSSPKKQKVLDQNLDNLQTVPLEDVPDSYLDDDAMWSQNFESASYIRQGEISHQQTKEFKSRNSERLQRNIKEPPKKKPENGIQTKDVGSKLPQGFGHDVKREPVSPEQQPFVNTHGNQKVMEKRVEASTVTQQPIAPNHSTNNTTLADYDHSIPLDLAQVCAVELVVVRKQRVPSETNDRAVKNFKRFRKVWPTYMKHHMPDGDSVSSHPPIPHIIGKRDLIVYCERKDKPPDIGKWFSNNEEENFNPFL